MAFTANFQSIAENFVAHFYKLFKEDRSQLHVMYHPDHSFLTFEGAQIQGREAIHAKYSSLPFQSVNMEITKMDSHPTVDGGVIIMVIGQLQPDGGDQKALSFSQMFHLKPIASADGPWMVHNDIFRLGVHNF